MIAWLKGWYTTLHMRIFERETYDFLVNYRLDPDDLVDVDRPDEWHHRPEGES